MCVCERQRRESESACEREREADMRGERDRGKRETEEKAEIENGGGKKRAVVVVGARVCDARGDFIELRSSTCSRRKANLFQDGVRKRWQHSCNVNNQLN